jgi:hypothetical protein
MAGYQSGRVTYLTQNHRALDVGVQMLVQVPKTEKNWLELEIETADEDLKA